MNKAQLAGWEHLTHLEKSVLSLVIVSGKTKQEASIILNIYPYKFTEFFNRAQKLWTLFTDHYQKYLNLVPILNSISPEEYTFINLVLRSRAKPSDLISTMPEFHSLSRTGTVRQLWDRVLREVQLNPSDHHSDFYRVIKVFDQWNNFRILPPEYRLPSPFPRRRNREFKKIHDQLNSISEIGWAMVEKKFGTKNPPIAFIPRTDEFFSAMSVSLTKRVLIYCTRNKLPIFSRKNQAEEFAEASYDFYRLSRTSTYSAQKFWANFRLRLQSAINYNELLGIIPGAFREFSSRDRAFLRKASEKLTFKPALPQTRTDPNKFWDNQ